MLKDILKYPPWLDRDKPRKHIVSISGGKDSTATYLLALEKLDGDFTAVFSHTGLDHPKTLAYIERISQITGGPKVQIIEADFSQALKKRKESFQSGKLLRYGWTRERMAEVLKNDFAASGNPFLDLCKLHSGLPSLVRKYCTSDLKIKLFNKAVYIPAIMQGYIPIVWNGRRALESTKRACLPKWERPRISKQVAYYHPIIGYDLDDLARVFKRHNMPLNPLYHEGFSRVSCMPCILSSKTEIYLLSKLYPDCLNRIRDWQDEIRKYSKSGIVDFFHKFGGDLDKIIYWANHDRKGRPINLQIKPAEIVQILQSL